MDRKILWFLIIFVFQILIVYIIGSVIAWNPHPWEWLLFTTTIGRIFLVILVIIMIKNAAEGCEDNYD